MHHAHRRDHEHTRRVRRAGWRRPALLPRAPPAGARARGRSRRPWSRPRANIHRGAGDRTGRRHASEKSRADRGESLSDEFAVGVVGAGVGEGGGDARRQQRLDRRERGDGDARAGRAARARPVENERQAERGKSGRQCPDDGERRRQHECQHRDDDDAHERARDRSVHARQQVHAGRDDPDRAERPQQIDRVRRGERGQRGHHDVRVQDAAGIDSGEGGHLLQEDDDRDAEREAFDDRPRDERHRAPEAQQPRRSAR